MKVSQVRLAGFMRHDALTVDIPERGVVLVTGPNGSGKSSVVEGVSMGLWGKTVRGTSPWRDGAKGCAAVVTDCAVALRSRSKGGKTALEWSPSEGEPEAWENAQKAQAALAALVGPWEVWRRTAVFTASDAAHFSLASDGERKRLLEAVLGLDQFDGALEACRSARKAVEAKLAKVTASIAWQRGQLATLERWLADAEEGAEPVLSAPDAAEMARAAALKAGALADHRAARAETRRLGEEAAECRALHRSATLRQAAALHVAVCPTCKRPMPLDTAAHVHATSDAEVADLDAALQAAAGRLTEAREAEEELEDEVRVLASRLAGLTEDADAAERATEARGRLDAKLARTRDEVVYTREQLLDGQTMGAALAVEVATLEVVEAALGLRGVRAHVLARALRGVESVANIWLGRIAGDGKRLKLSAYTEKADGGVSDAIFLDVIGAGGGHGYKAASTGERRRIDVALLLALSEVASAAVGAAPGTLWLDEVFDGLDEEGVHAVVDALRALSAERAVVVITHNPVLIQALPGANNVRMV